MTDIHPAPCTTDEVPDGLTLADGLFALVEGLTTLACAIQNLDNNTLDDTDVDERAAPIYDARELDED